MYVCIRTIRTAGVRHTVEVISIQFSGKTLCRLIRDKYLRISCKERGDSIKSSTNIILFILQYTGNAIRTTSGAAHNRKRLIPNSASPKKNIATVTSIVVRAATKPDVPASPADWTNSVARTADDASICRRNATTKTTAKTDRTSKAAVNIRPSIFFPPISI